jgi:signal transduction histidine kinase
VIALDSNVDSHMIAEEQAALQHVATPNGVAALRRVAELIVRDGEPEKIFGAVVREASWLLGDCPTALLRYEPGGDAIVVAIHGGPATVGMRVPADGNGIAARVLRTGRPARLDSYAAVPGSAPVIARRIGLGAAAGAPILGKGRLWGLLGAMTSGDPLPAGTEDQLAEFADLVAAGIAHAETRAALAASRARVLATADATRRRIQRDLHDGAQQRLMHTVVTLRLATATLGDDRSRETALVNEALHNAELATAELGELVRGILPASLTRGGLRAGAESLSCRVDLPVHVHVTPIRLPTAVETTAYFVVAEALTNAVKHARATAAHVLAAVADCVLEVEVRDDGAGGADPSRGTGLIGLSDRVAACGGSMAIASAPGEGTTLTAQLPIPPSSPTGRTPS